MELLDEMEAEAARGLDVAPTTHSYETAMRACALCGQVPPAGTGPGATLRPYTYNQRNLGKPLRLTQPASVF